MPDSPKIKNCQETVAIIGESREALEKGKYTLVTQTPPVIEAATERGESVIEDFAATAAILAVMAAKQPFHQIMDDPTWRNMGIPLKAVENTLSDLLGTDNVKPPVFPSTPVDLPISLALERIEHLLNHPNIKDIPTLEELSELAMANTEGRPISEARFRPESLEAITWSETTRSLEGCERLRAEVEKRLMATENREQASDSTLSLLRLAMNELDYAIEHHPSNHEDLAPKI